MRIRNGYAIYVKKTYAFHLVYLRLDSGIIFKYMSILQTKMVITNTMNNIGTVFFSHFLCDFHSMLRYGD